MTKASEPNAVFLIRNMSLLAPPAYWFSISQVVYVPASLRCGPALPAPVTRMFPETASFSDGSVVPIPTFPPFVNLTFSEPSKKKPKSLSFDACLIPAI